MARNGMEWRRHFHKPKRAQVRPSSGSASHKASNHPSKLAYANCRRVAPKSHMRNAENDNVTIAPVLSLGKCFSSSSSLPPLQTVINQCADKIRVRRPLSRPRKSQFRPQTNIRRARKIRRQAGLPLRRYSALISVIQLERMMSILCMHEATN